jgi:hypothetical protein
VGSWRSSFRAVANTLIVGALFGLLAPLLLAIGGSAGRVANVVLAAGWAWAALAFWVGATRKSRPQSAVLAVVSLLAAVIAYYVTRLTQGGFLKADLRDPTGRAVQLDWFGFLSNTIVWCVAACVLGLLLGLAGNLARGRGLRGLPFRTVVPLVAIADTSMRLRSDVELQGSAATTAWSCLRLAATASILVLVVHAVAVTSWSRPPVRKESSPGE